MAFEIPLVHNMAHGYVVALTLRLLVSNTTAVEATWIAHSRRCDVLITPIVHADRSRRSLTPIVHTDRSQEPFEQPIKMIEIDVTDLNAASLARRIFFDCDRAT